MCSIFALGTLTNTAVAAQTSSDGAAPEVRVNLATSEPAPDELTVIAEKVQNPISDLISFPFQNNTYVHVGPRNGVQNVLNVQPVIPIHVNDEWNVITRTILPLTWSPSLQPESSVPPFGLQPVTFSAVVSPATTFDGWTFGAGPIAQLPTGTSKALGSNVWGIGPAVIGTRTVHPWVTGLLVNTVFSAGGTFGPSGTKYTLTTINPFIHYNFGRGWFVGTNAVITANWDGPGEKWTLPAGVQGGRLVRLRGKLPVNFLVGAFYNALRPQGTGTWDLRTQITLVF